jgi:hypothetical protein
MTLYGDIPEYKAGSRVRSLLLNKLVSERKQGFRECREAFSNLTLIFEAENGEVVVGGVCDAIDRMRWVLEVYASPDDNLTGFT